MLIEIDGRRVEFARPEKWVWYESRYTMLDLAKYYVAVSPWLLPYLAARPVVYEIYPGTINGPNSFEQDPPAGTPRWIKRVRIQGRERTVSYVVVDSPATLVYLVSIFMVTLHVWESTTRAIERPDFLLLDLDPAQGCSLARLARTALDARDLLGELGISNALVKTSGARGLHVFVPIEPEYDYESVRTLTQHLARELAQRHPDRVTAERETSKRPPASVHVDWGQLGRGMTIVPPYVPRACPGAPVSMPLEWSDVERYAHSRSQRPPMDAFSRYTIANVVAQLKDAGDPWAARRPVSLSRAISTSPSSARSRLAAR